MVILEIGGEASAGNCQTLVPKRGEDLQVGDRVELITPGLAASFHGIVVGNLPNDWSVWVSG